MSGAQGNVGGRFVGRLRSSPSPVPGWFRAPARWSKLGPGGWCGVGAYADRALSNPGAGWQGAQRRPGLSQALRPGPGAGPPRFGP
jgi:hypothetical protein